MKIWGAECPRFQLYHSCLSCLERCAPLGPAGSRHWDRIKHVRISWRETSGWEEMGRELGRLGRQWCKSLLSKGVGGREVDGNIWDCWADKEVSTRMLGSLRAKSAAMLGRTSVASWLHSGIGREQPVGSVALYFWAQQLEPLMNYTAWVGGLWGSIPWLPQSQWEELSQMPLTHIFLWVCLLLGCGCFLSRGSSWWFICGSLLDLVVHKAICCIGPAAAVALGLPYLPVIEGAMLVLWERSESFCQWEPGTGRGLWCWSRVGEGLECCAEEVRHYPEGSREPLKSFQHGEKYGGFMKEENSSSRRNELPGEEGCREGGKQRDQLGRYCSHMVKVMGEKEHLYHLLHL